MPSIRIFAIATIWAIVVLGMPVTTRAQTIDTRAARATVGAPLHLTLRVRDFEAGPASLGRDCLQAELRQGDTPQTLRWLSSTRTSDGDTWVTLTSAQAVQEPILLIKVALLCSASFVREFTLLAEPPPPHRPAQAAASARRRAAGPAPPIQPQSRPPALAPIGTGSAMELAQVAMADPSQPIRPLGTARVGPASLTDHSASTRPDGVTTVGAAPSASPLTDAFVELWQQDMQAVREELRQSRAALASMSARLERSERDTWQLWGSLAALAAGLTMVAVLWRVMRDLRLRRFTRIDPPVQTPATVPFNVPEATDLPAAAGRSAAQPAPPLIPEPMPEAALASAETADPIDALTWDGPQDGPLSRWAQSDFGQPALDETRHAELLAKVDAITAGGYYGASVAVLENALQSRVGKSAGILLRLLDLYRLLKQPWNHERVSAEIEAIYNVRVPSIGESSEGRNLDAHERTWQEITLNWGRADAAAQLSQLLVRPTRIEVLDLAAFRDALMLHTMSLLRDTPTGMADDTAAEEPSLLPWPVQGATA